ncbi:MAG: dienelactone hydrolase family protein [Saprospiraceae bacterium]|jgi:polyhydroxybutyrate depolymerase|nr:dienelactone hydrolase family protein [Saprospiraceae bacterium]
MMYKTISLSALRLLAFSTLTLFAACNKNDDNPAGYVTGQNRFTIQINGDTREYYVHVPAGYNPNTPAPMVVMLHGTSGDGEKFYNISGWKEVGEAENILTVFPSSWNYCIVEDGQSTNTTKWTVYPGSFDYCPGQTPRDDIKFLREMIASLSQTFKVDAKRIYLAGFSNGGQMAFRCAVEMSDVLAAVVECAGTSGPDTTYTPKRKLPVAFQLGDKDDRYFQQQIPLFAFEQGLNTVDFFKRMVSTHQKTFGFSQTYTMSGDTTTAMIATYPSATPGENREYLVGMIYNMGHVYPNGTNHWMKGAEVHWNWFKQYSLP